MQNPGCIVKFIFILHLIILPYTVLEPTPWLGASFWTSVNSRFF
jgi:hypothetical protein